MRSTRDKTEERYLPIAELFMQRTARVCVHERPCLWQSLNGFENASMGAAASLPVMSRDQRASLHVAVLEAFPANVYALEEGRFRAGSFYDEKKEFEPHRKHCALFAALGFHEWSVQHLWRHFRRVRGILDILLIKTYFLDKQVQLQQYVIVGPI